MKKIFISYSGLDATKVKTLHDKIALQKLIKPIVVEYSKTPMQFLSKKVIEQLNKVDYFVPIMTHNSIPTQYMNQELGYALANKIPIIPIVEDEIIYNLRGFITAQNDLPFSFRTFMGDKKKERKDFRNCCDLLISHILTKVDKSKVALNLSAIFKGEWRNDYKIPNGDEGSESVIIKNGNKYFMNGKYMFFLDQIFISKDRKTIRFRKNGVNPGDNRKAVNVLNLKSPNVYAGDEHGNIVVYTKVN